MSCLILSISGVYMATLRKKHICHVCIFVRPEVLSAAVCRQE